MAGSLPKTTERVRHEPLTSYLGRKKYLYPSLGVRVSLTLFYGSLQVDTWLKSKMFTMTV